MKKDPTELDRLANEWQLWKQAESDAAKARIEVEEKMIALLPNENKVEGTTAQDQNYFKVSANFGVTRTVDQTKVDSLFGDDLRENELIAAIFPTAHKLDLKQLRAVELVNKQLYKHACKAISTKPRKTSISIKELGKN